MDLKSARKSQQDLQCNLIWLCNCGDINTRLGCFKKFIEKMELKDMFILVQKSIKSMHSFVFIVFLFHGLFEDPLDLKSLECGKDFAFFFFYFACANRIYNLPLSSSLIKFIF